MRSGSKNDSTKSWIFADLEKRRRAAIAALTPADAPTAGTDSATPPGGLGTRIYQERTRKRQTDVIELAYGLLWIVGCDRSTPNGQALYLARKALYEQIFNIPKGTTEICVSTIDYADIKEWIG